MFKRLSYDTLNSASNKCTSPNCCELENLVDQDLPQVWTLYYNDLHYQVKLINYETIHGLFGCRDLERLYRKCSLDQLVAIATLIYYTHYQTPIPTDYRCLIRKRDQAVGVDLGDRKIYLIPGKVDADNLSGFLIHNKSK